MPFDLSAVTAKANEVMANGNQGEGGNRDYKYKLVYPGTVGTLSVKLLFNPKANTVSRLVNNHKVDGVNVPCMRTWDQECPICKALQDIKNTTGTDHPQLRSTTRGISLAQYVSSSYKIEDINPGDIILFMYPWTVYKDLQQSFQQARTQEELAMIIASNEGMVFDITHGQDNRYSAQINAFNKFKSCASDEEFEVMLNGLDSLNDLYRPSTPSEEQMNTINDTARELRSQFLSSNTQTGFGATSSYNQPQQFNNNPPQSVYDEDIPFNNRSSSNVVPTMAQTPQVPMNQTSSRSQTVPMPTTQGTLPNTNTNTNPTPTGFQVPTVTDSAASMDTRPACFGRYGDPSINPSQCGLCGSDFDCIAASGSN